jgi:hypothetical protein
MLQKVADVTFFIITNVHRIQVRFPNGLEYLREKNEVKKREG